MSTALPREADAVIIGAGITGCSTAYRLSQRGWKVVVLEKDDIAHEASGRTMAAVGLVGKHHPDEFALAKASMDIWYGLNEELGTDIELNEGGKIGNRQLRRGPSVIRGNDWRGGGLGGEH